MNSCHFCTGCEYIRTRMFSGHQGKEVKEVSCPAQFNPRQGKWSPEKGKNPHECPRNEMFVQAGKRNNEQGLE